MYYPNFRFKMGEILAIREAFPQWEESLCPIWYIEDRAKLETALVEINALWKGRQIVDLSRYVFNTVSIKALSILVELQLPFLVNPSDLDMLNGDACRHFDNAPSFRVTTVQLARAIEHNNVASFLAPITRYGTDTPAFVLLDLGEIAEYEEQHVEYVVNLLKVLYINGVKNIAFSCGAFPKSMEDIKGEGFFIRHDKLFYDDVMSQVDFRVAYSDYGTLNPEWDQGQTRRSGHTAIKYTLEDRWLILRQKGKDRSAIYELAQLLILHDDYKGRDFSWADDNWHKKALTPPQAGPGRAGDHVGEFMNHHIAHVLTLD